MPRPRWSPVYVYIAVFGAVVAWGMSRQPHLTRQASAGVVTASMQSNAGHDLRRITQRMVIR
jgi:hypothetical protein